MKLSVNSLGIFFFTAIATLAFVWMAKRPAVEGDVIQFGMPTPTIKEAPKAQEQEATTNTEPENNSDKKPEEGDKANSTTAETDEKTKP